ncbi:MAG: alpha/beta hydrolase [Candidatus Dormibacteraeota bacterium]|nr:alpha/beta hydrolase [Candidatus Dormibacteraeota bacterium]
MSRAVAQRAIELDGARIEYLEAGGGATMVFFHGAGGVSPNPAFISTLAKRYRILLPSRPGFDGSTGDAETIRDVARVMGSFVREMADGPVHLIGESAGGEPACWLAVLEPGIVESLVLVAPAAFHVRPPSARHDPPPGQGELEERLFGRSPAWSAPPTEEEVARRQKNSAYHMARWQSSEPDQELLRRLAEIQARTLVLWGTADRVIPPEQGELYQRSIPRAHLVYVYGAAHSLPVAAAGPFVRLVTGFIEQGETFVVNQDPAAVAR